MLVLAQTGGVVDFVRTPVRHNSTLRRAEQGAFRAAVATEQAQRRHNGGDERICAGALDDLVTVEVLLVEQGLDALASRALTETFQCHPDVQWIASYEGEQSRRLHRVRCSCWPIASALVQENLALVVIGLDLRAPQPLYRWLAPSTTRARSRYPTVDVALAIEWGQRLTLAECRGMDVWLERRWGGDARVEAVVTELGDTVYEVLGSRQRTSERDWLCEFPCAANAADLAALLNASAGGLLRELAHKRHV